MFSIFYTRNPISSQVPQHYFLSSLGLPIIISPKRPSKSCLRASRLEVCEGQSKKQEAEDELWFERSLNTQKLQAGLGRLPGLGTFLSKTGGPILSPNQTLGVLCILNCSTPTVGWRMWLLIYTLLLKDHKMSKQERAKRDHLNQIQFTQEETGAQEGEGPPNYTASQWLPSLEQNQNSDSCDSQSVDKYSP